MAKYNKFRSEKKSTSGSLRNPITSKNFQLVRIGTLKPYDGNPKQHPVKQIEKLANSITAFGMVVPILVDAGMRIIAGHGRLLAAQQAGLTHVPIVKISHLGEAQVRALRIADNRLTELGTWSEKALKTEFKFLIEAELNCEIDFTAEITGFLSAEIDSLIESVPGVGDDDPQAGPAIALGKPAITKSGNTWICGKHSIICGDALDPIIYKKLLKGIQVKLVCSDPPYNLDIDGVVSGNGATKHREFAMASGEMSSREFVEFLYGFLSNALSHLAEGACVYVFMDWRHDQELQEAANKCGLTQINLCVWDKGVGGMGSFYRSQHELVFVYRKGNKSHQNNIQLGRYGRNRSNVWSYPSANMSRQGREALKDHPTPKPVSMIADILKDVTKTGEVVLDPFLGSGGTLLAAEKTKRRCYGIEIDPYYVDLCIRRWQEHTGLQAVNAETGLTFAAQEQQGGPHE